MVISSTRNIRASFNPVFRTQHFISGPDSATPNDYLDQLDYDDDDDLNDDESIAESNADSVITDPSSDPSKFKLEITIFEEDSGSTESSAFKSGSVLPETDIDNKDTDLLSGNSNTIEQGSTSAPLEFASDTTKHLKKDVLALGNETLWDIFDLVFECENYKKSLTASAGTSTSAAPLKRAVVYTPQFRDEMKHKYNLVRNAVFDKCNTKLESIFEPGAFDNNSSLVATIIPSLSQGNINTTDKIDTSAIASWLESEVAPEVSRFWESVDGEKMEQKETGRAIQKPNVYDKDFFSSLEKEVEFVTAIDRDMIERKKLMDGIVVDFSSLIGIGGANQNSPESPMATMGPLLAAKMVADTLPVARISKFIPYLARFAYVQNLLEVNEVLLSEVKNAIAKYSSLGPIEEKALQQAQDFDSIVRVFNPKFASSRPPAHHFPVSSNSYTPPKTPHSSSPNELKDGKIKAEEHSPYGSQTSINSSPSFSGSSAVARHSVSFFPNNHRRTASTSSVSSLVSGNSSASIPNGQFPLGTGSVAAAAAAATSSSGSRTPSTPLPLSLFPAAGISSSASSSASTTAALSMISTSGSATTPGTPTTSGPEGEVDERKLVGPLLAPFLALNIISPNLEAIYPDYLSFLHTVFSAWTNMSNQSISGSSAVGFSALGGAMSPPTTRPLFNIPETVKMQTALGGIYLTLINHSTTQKVPAISRCFAVMQHQVQSQHTSRVNMRDLDALKTKLVEVYNDWVASQPPPEVVPMSQRGSLAAHTADASSDSSLSRKGSVSAKGGATGNKKPSAVNESGLPQTVPANDHRSLNSTTGNFSLPVSHEGSHTPSANKPKHKANQSISSNNSDGPKNPAPAPSLPTPCTKCFHNHKGNNCARKCYVCRMAKLAAQHGHIVELKTGTAPVAPSPTTATNNTATTSSANQQASTAVTPTSASHPGNNNANMNKGFNNNNNNNNSNFNMNGGLNRSSSVKTRNNPYIRTNNTNNNNNNTNINTGNFNNNGGNRNNHNRAQSYSANGYNNGNHRRTQSYSHQNGANYHNMNGMNMNGMAVMHTYQPGMTPPHFSANGVNMSYSSNNGNNMNYGNSNGANPGNNNNGGNNNRNAHRRNPSNAATRFPPVRVGTQFQGNQ